MPVYATFHNWASVMGVYFVGVDCVGLTQLCGGDDRFIAYKGKI